MLIIVPEKKTAITLGEVFTRVHDIVRSISINF